MLHEEKNIKTPTIFNDTSKITRFAKFATYNIIITQYGMRYGLRVGKYCNTFDEIRNNILHVEVVIVQYSSFVVKINIAYVGHSSTIWVHPSHQN